MRGASSGSKRPTISLVAEPHDGDGFGAGRLDQLHRRRNRRHARLLGWLRIEAAEVLGPDAEDHLLVADARRRHCREGRATAALPLAVLTDSAGLPPSLTTSAGMKFIAGDPMKPATNMLAGRS